VGDSVGTSVGVGDGPGVCAREGLMVGFGVGARVLALHIST
jgi:hypothetical protein